MNEERKMNEQDLSQVERPSKEQDPIEVERTSIEESPLFEERSSHEENMAQEDRFSHEESTTSEELHEESQAYRKAHIQDNFSSHEEGPTVEITQEKKRQEKKPKGTKVKSFMSMVAAGVIGSALTFTAIPYLPQFNDHSSAVASSDAGVTNSSASLPIRQVSNSANSIADIVESSSKAIVGISNKQMQTNPFNRQMSTEAVEVGSGSGVIFKKANNETYIVTNNHVIEGAKEVEVSLYNGEKMPATLVGTDPLTDIAVIKITGKVDYDPLPFGDSSSLRAGDQVLAIGNPLGLDFSRTVTQGIVSAVDRSIQVDTSAGKWDLHVIQTDAAINPGNSGGALINAAGQLVGINSLKISDSNVEGLGFAIPSNDVQTIIDELIDNGKVVRPYLGVGLANLSEIPQFFLQNLPSNVEEGAIVTTVDQSSAAAKAGLQAEDIIVSIGGHKVTGPDDLRKYLYSDYKIGDQVDIEYYRQGKLSKVTVTLTSNQAAN